MLASVEASTELTEIVGIRLMLTNLFRPLATGQKLTPEAFDNMLAEVKKRKRGSQPMRCKTWSVHDADDTMGPQRDHHLPAAQPDLHLRSDLLRFVLTGLFLYLRFSLRPDAAAAVLHADLSTGEPWAGRSKDAPVPTPLCRRRQHRSGKSHSSRTCRRGRRLASRESKFRSRSPAMRSAQGLRRSLSRAGTEVHRWPLARLFETRSSPAISSGTSTSGRSSFGFLSLLVQLPFSIRKDIRRRKELKYGRRLKGPVLLTPKEFNKTVAGDGIGFETTEAKDMMRIPLQAEAQHIELMGDTGAGKTTLIMQVLRQIQSRGHSAIVYDPACEFIQRFYDERRGDIVLNPLDERCPYWGPSEELRRKAEAKAIAASLYQPTSDKKGEFFTETPQKIFAHLLTYGPNPQQLVEWLSNPAEIDKRVGTEMEAMIAKGAQQQRNGVLASLGSGGRQPSDAAHQGTGQEQNLERNGMGEERKGWIFITSSATEREALRPLHSLWIDLLVMRLLTAPQENQTPVWFVLGRTRQPAAAPATPHGHHREPEIQEPAGSRLSGKAQLEVIYGHLAEVMLSQPATKIFLKTTEPKAAEWVSNAIGKIEIERMKETHFDGSRSGKNFTLDRQVEPLVMDSEISGLENRHAFLKLGNNVARFHFEYMDVAQTTPGFVPRKVEDDELPFDPKTLVPKAPAPATPGIDLEARRPIAKSRSAGRRKIELEEPKMRSRGANRGRDRGKRLDPDSPDDDQEEDVPIAKRMNRCASETAHAHHLQTAQLRTGADLSRQGVHVCGAELLEAGRLDSWRVARPDGRTVRSCRGHRREHFARLSEGQNPLTGEQLVRHRNGQEYTTAEGTTVKPVEHRAGWDATFSAPKSVSLTALVGGDDRVR